ncbi:MAG: hypothetical protein R3D29_06380 [Nitratireductor sp.]
MSGKRARLGSNPIASQTLALFLAIQGTGAQTGDELTEKRAQTLRFGTQTGILLKSSRFATGHKAFLDQQPA